MASSLFTSPSALSYRKQRTLWPSTSTSSGTFVRQMSMQESQRSEKWQPGGISNGFGTMPLIMYRRFESSSSRRGMDFSRPSV